MTHTCAAGVLALLALGCAAEDEPRGTVELSVTGLAASDVVTIAVRHPPNILGEGGHELWFTDVGNGVHVRDDAPARGQYTAGCVVPGGTDAAYEAIGPVEPSAWLDVDGQTIRLACDYRELGYVGLVFVGLDETISDEFCIGTVTETATGATKTWCAGQSGLVVPLRPGSYDVSCESIVGNPSTTTHVLTDISPAHIALSSGQTEESTCTYEPQP